MIARYSDRSNRFVSQKSAPSHSRFFLQGHLRNKAAIPQTHAETSFLSYEEKAVENV
jgi:hypothetical protein